MAKLHERTRARQCALQVLYTSEIQGCTPAEVMGSERFLMEEGELSEYAEELVRGVTRNIMSIDAKLASTSENWSVARMPIVDRCVLRLAAYEMLYEDAVPVSVSINEAVELAKDFGGEDESHRFVNGVLGRIARQMEEGDLSSMFQQDFAEAREAEKADGASAPVEAGSADEVPAQADVSGEAGEDVESSESL